MGRSAIAACALALVVAGCGGDGTPAEDPGAFVKAVVTDLYAGDSGAVWETLHPQHQATVPRARYVACERRAPLPERLQRIEVVSITDTPSTVPGEAESVDSKAVEVRLTVEPPGGEAAQPITHTVHVFAVDGRWAWVIGPTDFASYAAGDCPGGA